MPQRVTLDAMIPRADFEVQGKEFELDLPREIQVINALEQSSPFLRLLRKPDFQRETNQWSPEQLASFIASFLDNEVIPGLILWKSPNHVFVIDGGHRLSALRAWVEDDYGDKTTSLQYYGGTITDEQRRIAIRTRKLVEKKTGRFTDLKAMVGGTVGTEVQLQRANRLFMRTIQTQWIQGSAQVAETSFFKINSQGTPLDETEEMLIRCRRTPIAISARAILRAGSGHKYWSAFQDDAIRQIEIFGRNFLLDDIRTRNPRAAENIGAVNWRVSFPG